MDELRESSLLFSLNSLLETERQRVEREAREAEQRQRQELQRVAELAERRRLAEQQEREARARRQQLEQERERLERERLEAMKQAAIERARVEAESQARLVEMEQKRQHDVEMSRLHARESYTRYRSLFWLSSAFAVFAVSLGLGGWLGVVRPSHARELQQLRDVIGATEARSAASARALAAERSKSQALEERVAQLQREVARSDAAAVTPSKGTPAKPTLGPGKLRPVRPGPGCVDDGDPLRGCLR